MSGLNSVVAKILTHVLGRTRRDKMERSRHLLHLAFDYTCSQISLSIKILILHSWELTHLVGLCKRGKKNPGRAAWLVLEVQALVSLWEDGSWANGIPH